MARWHHQLNGHESGWALGVGDGQGGLACCDSWCCKESDTTEQLNWTEPCALAKLLLFPRQVVHPSSLAYPFISTVFSIQHLSLNRPCSINSNFTRIEGWRQVQRCFSFQTFIYFYWLSSFKASSCGLTALSRLHPCQLRTGSSRRSDELVSTDLPSCFCCLSSITPQFYRLHSCLPLILTLYCVTSVLMPTLILRNFFPFHLHYLNSFFLLIFGSVHPNSFLYFAWLLHTLVSWCGIKSFNTYLIWNFMGKVFIFTS